MTDPLSRLFAHHHWATRALIERCATLPAESWNLTAPGTQGTIGVTVNHLLGAEARYLDRLGFPVDDPADERNPRPVSALAPEVDRLAAVWARALPELRAESRRELVLRGQASWLTDWILIAQAIHHGQDHRTHLTTVLAANGIEHPEVDGWDYVDASVAGRALPDPPPTGEGVAGVTRHLFDHGRWANRALTEFCLGLPQGWQALSAAGTYGTLGATLSHLLDSELYYHMRLSGQPIVDRPDDPDPARLRAVLDELDRAWPEMFDAGLSTDREIPRRDGGGMLTEWSFLINTVGHGNEHRANIGTVLGANGIEPPDLDVWAYGSAVGAMP